MQGYGGINIADGVSTQALSTSQAQLTVWNQAAGSNISSGYDRDGNIGARGDKANNRMLVAAGGMYRFHLNICGTVDAAQDLTVQLAKNGNAMVGAKFSARFSTTMSNLSFEGIFELKQTDNPGTIPAFPEPAVGTGLAPKVMVPITVLISSGAGTPTITVTQANLLIDKYE